MLEENYGKMPIRLLDFGMAAPIDGKDGSTGFLKDMIHVVSNFIAMYIGLEFNSRISLETNWKDEVQQIAELYGLSGEDIEELFSLIDMALNVSRDQMPFDKRLADILNTDHQLENELKQVAKILFPVTSQGQETEQQIGSFENTGQSNRTQTEAEDLVSMRCNNNKIT
ncbi:unnamed protein product [Mytilus edulis]|uniref:Uncharacterized protein n=1 Tax=Mytilus edulis TaxID=6550 RepID=A0A8S3VCC5_MYTED|nr:unnamed protein product [Mytilus edulis]